MIGGCMTKQATIEYLESLVTGYIGSQVVNKQNSEYRMIWISANDVIAINHAIDELRGIKSTGNDF